MSNNTDLLGQALAPMVSNVVTEEIKKLGIEEKITEALNIAVKNAAKVIEVKDIHGTVVKMGVQHKQFEKILKLINMGENLMIKGEAGNGKSHVVAEVAKALKIPFHSMSVSNQTTKTDLMGFVDANGVYRYNGFIAAFRDGGIFNMDEIDAGNANVLVVMNSALSNGFIETPAGDMIYAHKDFRFVSTANTVGRGATSKYVGRNKLDSATLDRFAVINFELDEDIELMLCDGDKNFHEAILAMRKYANANYEEVMISQRSAVRLKNLIKEDFELIDALEIAVFKGVDEDIVKALTKEFKKHYTVKAAKVVPAYNDRVLTAEDNVTVINVDEDDDEDDDFNW